MGDVTGPISTLPGARHVLPQGACCDSHPARPAVRRVQGETDSFGSELVDMCRECADEADAYAREARCGLCEWCGGQATDLRDARDYDEGMCGPVYRVCGSCRTRRDQEAAEELDSFADEDPAWDE